MKFGTGFTAKLTQKCQDQSTKMTYICPNIYVTVLGKRDQLYVKSKMYSRAQTPTKQFFLVFFLFTHRYLLPFSYTDTKFEWLQPLLKVQAPRLNTVTFYSLFWPSVRARKSNPRVIENRGRIQFVNVEFRNLTRSPRYRLRKTVTYAWKMVAISWTAVIYSWGHLLHGGGLTQFRPYIV